MLRFAIRGTAVAMAAFCAVAVGSAGLTVAPAEAATSAAGGSAWAQADAALSLPAAHALSVGRGVTVAVVDTGVSASVPGLRGQVIEGPQYVTGGTLDGGWGIHGTEMASDVLHVAPGARILSVRVLADNGGGTDRAKDPVASGIRYAAQHGAKVITLSLGNSEGAFGSYDRYEAAAVQYAVARGERLVVLAAAGNNASPAPAGFVSGASSGEDDESFPAGFTPVIGVGAVTSAGQHAYFSTVHSYVSVSAPGISVPGISSDGRLFSDTGTSPACALTAGVAALILSRYPHLAPLQVATALEHGVARPGAPWNPLVGYGSVDAAAALRAAAVLRPAPSSQPPVAYHGPAYFGQGPAAARLPDRPMFATRSLISAIAFLAAGLTLIGVAVRLHRRGRRRAGAAGRRRRSAPS